MNTVQNRRILLVDDTPAIHDDFRKILNVELSEADVDSDLTKEEEILFGVQSSAPNVESFQLESAYQGLEAIEKVDKALLANLPYAMAFVDIRMPPGLDGIETIERLWQKDPKLQVVLCTAYSDYSWTEVLNRLAARDRLLILKKPFDAIEVYQLAHTLTMKWHIAEQAILAVSNLETAVSRRTHELNTVINNIPQGLCLFDAAHNLVTSNKRFAEIYRLDPHMVTPGTPVHVILEHRRTAGTQVNTGDRYLRAELIAAEFAKEPWYRVDELADGRSIAVSYHPLPDYGAVISHEDITARRSAEAQIEFMAHHDVLTHLPNRIRFRENVTRALNRRGPADSVAVFCLDIDFFKPVNDTLGHPIGDALLQAIAGRLQASVRSTDSLARLGGDEFAVVQIPKNPPADCITLAKRIIEAIAQPFELEGHQIVVGASIGIAIAPADGNDFDRLLKNADMALYRAKIEGRGAYRFFEPQMDETMQARRALELDLRKALALGEFELHYQPILALETNRITGFEALLRWRHPQKGLVPPDQFIPLSEEIGLIGAIGAWVLKQACAEAARWPDDIAIAVNISPLQFLSGSIVLNVITALEAAGLAANRLELEITEAVFLQDTETTVSTLQQLRKLGVRIAMDDFGTGYSSLSYLQKFSFDKIKIDRSFINTLQESPEAVAIVRAVTGLSSALGMTTTAEGVETIGQLDQLRNEGCTEVQGYLFSRPLPADELGLLLTKFHSRSAVA